MIFSFAGPADAAGGAAGAAACTPSVTLRQPWVHRSGWSIYPVEYNTCGRLLALRLRSRISTADPYELVISTGKQGAGLARFGTCSSGLPAPLPAQYIASLKDGPTLVALSEPKSFTEPNQKSCDAPFPFGPAPS